MFRKTRDGLVGTLAACVVLIASASALGVTVSPSGSYTASSGGISLYLSGSGQFINCRAATVPMTISSAGAFSTSAGGATYTGCTNSVLGPVTIRQLVGVNGGVTTNATQTRIRFDVPFEAYEVTNTAGCLFRFGSPLTISTRPVDLWKSAPPYSWTTSDSIGTLPNIFLVVTWTNGRCSPLIVSLSQTVSFSGNYTFSRAATVTP